MLPPAGCQKMLQNGSSLHVLRRFRAGPPSSELCAREALESAPPRQTPENAPEGLQIVRLAKVPSGPPELGKGSGLGFSFSLAGEALTPGPGAKGAGGLISSCFTAFHGGRRIKSS